MSIQSQYKTLEDFLISHPLTVDAELDDGWGAKFPVKGVEIEAIILFADISNFTRRTRSLSGLETLIFVNNFFAWITAEAIGKKPCIVDKYIGDEVMLLFSKEFGSDDPFVDAVQTARWMGERDAWGFCPHMGIAGGPIIAGYVGTPVKYSASVFGSAVAVAKRCSDIQPAGTGHCRVSFPSSLWGERKVLDVLPPRSLPQSDGSTKAEYPSWFLEEPREVDLKNIGPVSIRTLVRVTEHFPNFSPEDQARESAKVLKQKGQYRPLHTE